MRQRAEDWLESIAMTAMVASIDDDQSLAVLADELAGLADSLSRAEGPAALAEEVVELIRAIAVLSGQPRRDPAALDAIRRGIAAVQDQHRAGAAEPGAAVVATRFRLHPSVDEATFLEFAAQQALAFEEIDEDLLGIERGDIRATASLRRKLHTLKGEAGLLGLDQVEALCHALEDHLDAGARMQLLCDARDWLGEAIAAYSQWRLPSRSADELVVALRAGTVPVDPALLAARADGTATFVAAPSLDETSVVAPTLAAPVPVAEHASGGTEQMTSVVSGEPGATDESEASVPWDAESLEVVGEFLQETDDGLGEVDDLLLKAGAGPVDTERVDALFRVFHTIKGVASFLDLTDFSTLAHATETLLQMARQGELAIEDAALDAIFDATAMMRGLLVALRNAVEAGRRPPPNEGLPSLVDRLRAIARGEAIESTEALPAVAGERIGDILRRDPVAACPDAIEAAAVAARTAGRPLGEELVAAKAATAKQVSQALRAQSAAGKEGEAGGAKIREVVKVDLERVDNLVALIGELVVVEAMIVNAPELTGSSSRLRRHVSQMSKITRDLQDIGTRMRMVPVRGVFRKMARMVADLSRKNGKLTTVCMQGEGTEIDRNLVQQLNDPLVHMIRNAVDHGIEARETRLAAGKPERATVTLKAYHQAGTVVIEVSDDGRGLDRDAILERAVARGLVGPGDQLSDADIYQLIFAPGFSTAKTVTEVSGRGVGMDVVRRSIESVRGRVQIDSRPGRGTTFTLVLPLTLAIIDGLLVTCGEEHYIIPALTVVESIKPDPSAVHVIAGRGEVVSLRESTLPLFRLERLFDIAGAEQDPSRALVVVVESRGRKLGLLVDDILSQQQVVIKPLGDSLRKVQFLSGAAIMADGRVGLILNTDNISELADRRSGRSAA